MTFHLTPDIMRRSYSLMASTPPIRGWRLPAEDEIVFRVSMTDKWQGLFDTYHDRYRISLSTEYLSLLVPVLGIMAHEMIHLYQRINDRETGEIQHNDDFRRLADRVTRYHGFPVY